MKNLLGVLAFGLLSANIAHANLLTNGGFETGNFTGWTVTDSSNYTTVASTGAFGYNSQSGNYFASLGATPNPGTVTQNVATVAGGTYSISFWLASNGQTPNSFSVSWNGSTLLDLTNIAVQPYTQYTLEGVASGSTSTLTFSEMDNPSYLALDSVNVTRVPEPAAVALFGIGLLGLVAARRKS